MWRFMGLHVAGESSGTVVAAAADDALVWLGAVVGFQVDFEVVAAIGWGFQVRN